METTYTDKVLGELIYKRAWIGANSVTWNSSVIPIKVKVKAANGQMPSDFQRQSFKRFTDPTTLQICKEKLLDYCKKIYDARLDDNTSDFEEYITPKTVILAQNEYWGVLFKCKWESEILLAVKFNESTIDVGVDDILL